MPSSLIAALTAFALTLAHPLALERPLTPAAVVRGLFAAGVALLLWWGYASARRYLRGQPA